MRTIRSTYANHGLLIGCETPSTQIYLLDRVILFLAAVVVNSTAIARSISSHNHGSFGSLTVRVIPSNGWPAASEVSQMILYNDSSHVSNPAVAPSNDTYSWNLEGGHQYLVEVYVDDMMRPVLVGFLL